MCRNDEGRAFSHRTRVLVGKERANKLGNTQILQTPNGNTGGQRIFKGWASMGNWAAVSRAVRGRAVELRCERRAGASPTRRGGWESTRDRGQQGEGPGLTQKQTATIAGVWGCGGLPA